MSGGRFYYKERVLCDIAYAINNDINKYEPTLGPLVLEMKKLSILVSGIYYLIRAYDLFIEENTGPGEFIEEMRRFEQRFETITKERSDEE